MKNLLVLLMLYFGYTLVTLLLTFKIMIDMNIKNDTMSAIVGGSVFVILHIGLRKLAATLVNMEK
jgi:hypothetical protein